MSDARRTDAPSGAERVKTVLAWIVVGVPALWGVAQVVERSAALFR